MMRKAPDHIKTRRLLLQRPQRRDAVEIFERYAGGGHPAPALGVPNLKPGTAEDVFCYALVDFGIRERNASSNG
jgi:hypothetical protein